MPSSHLILYRPLFLLPSIPPSIRVFSNESTLRIKWPKYWSFSFSISPSKEHSGPISFRMDQLDLLAVQGTLKSLLQHHSSKASKDTAEINEVKTKKIERSNKDLVFWKGKQNWWIFSATNPEEKREGPNQSNHRWRKRSYISDSIET